MKKLLLCALIACAAVASDALPVWVSNTAVNSHGTTKVIHYGRNFFEVPADVQYPITIETYGFGGGVGGTTQSHSVFKLWPWGVDDAFENDSWMHH